MYQAGYVQKAYESLISKKQLELEIRFYKAEGQTENSLSAFQEPNAMSQNRVLRSAETKVTYGL